VLRSNAVVELVWQDETGSTAITVLNCPSSSTYAEIDAAATAIASILVPLSDAVLVKTRYKYRFEVEPRVEPANSTPITRSGAFFFSTTGDVPEGMLTVPSIKEEVLSDVEPFAGVAIDLDNAAVIAFADAIITAGTTNPFADAFLELVQAYLQSRV